MTSTLPFVCNSAVMRVATWNLQWATPRSARHAAIRRHLEGVGKRTLLEVVVLTTPTSDTVEGEAEHEQQPAAGPE